MNLRTMGDMKKGISIKICLETQKNNPDKKETSSYTGGESSGMAVINPDVHNLMQKA
jgi:hypothetical protein